MNLRMADLKQSLEQAGLRDVKTLLSSGNAAFTTTAKSDAAVARIVEKALEKHAGRAFPTIVRRSDHLLALVQADPYAAFKLLPKAKRIVTFLREPHPSALRLPIASEGAHILAMDDGHVFSAYLPNPRGPVFMALIERTFGSGVTTRTWDTVRKCAAA